MALLCAAQVEEWLHQFRPSLSARDIVTFKHPEWWSATDEGHARLPLLFSLGGELVLHPTIANTPDGHVVGANNYTVRCCLPAGGWLLAVSWSVTYRQAVLLNQQASLRTAWVVRGMQFAAA